MGGMGPGHNVNSMGGQGPMGGGPSGPGPQTHPQMNGTTASALHALPASLPGQSSSSVLTQKLAGTQDGDMRRTMLGEHMVVYSHQEAQLETQKRFSVNTICTLSTHLVTVQPASVNKQCHCMPTLMLLHADSRIL